MNGGVFQKFISSLRRIESTGYKIPPKIAIALSGGVDSIVLLKLLTKFKENNINKNIEIHAITIDHGLRKESSKEANNLKNLILNINKYPIKHKILKIESKININQIEKHARELRYELMFEYCKKEKIENIFMGHHLDDQLETFLMRLFGNSTLFGLIGIKPITSSNIFGMNKINLIRPLLNISKDEIYNYANENNLKWFEDYTNNDPTLTQRNMIRKYLTNIDKESKNRICELHNKVCYIMEELIYKRMNLLKNGNNDGNILSFNVNVNQKLLSLTINIKIRKEYYENSMMNIIDYIVLDRMIFNEIWLVSPNRNYLYGYTKFDNKHCTLNENKNISRSLSEEIMNNLDKKTRNITLSGCLVEWKLIEENENFIQIRIKVYREKEHRYKQIQYNNIMKSDSKEFKFLFDNRVFIKLNSKIPIKEPFHIHVSNFNEKFVISEISKSPNFQSYATSRIPLVTCHCETGASATTLDTNSCLIFPTVNVSPVCFEGNTLEFTTSLKRKLPMW